jgi:nucleotide-binding universal stress UspA family protein
MSEKKVLIPVDFSEYSIQACEIGFNYASEIQAEVIVIHACFTPFLSQSIPLNDSFSLNDSFYYPAANTEINEKEVAGWLAKTKDDLKKFVDFIREKIKGGEWPDVFFTTVLREGLPEEVIASYCKEYRPNLIVMGTRGKSQKDADLIGSVTAEVIDMVKVPVFAIPEKTPFRNFSEIKKIAFGTSFGQKDFIAFETLCKIFQPYRVEFHLFHIEHKPNTWNEIKLAGIKEYFAKQYPNIKINYDLVDAHDFILNMEKLIRSQKIDIISLSTNKRNLFARMFNPSVARKMLFHTDTPLLAIRS